MSDIDLKALVDIAIEGGREVLAIYARDFPTMHKGDASPVTEADLRCEAVVARRLRDLAPGIPIVAEEAAAAGVLPPASDVFFLVDPLDGTKEFVGRNGDFTVNIALIRNGVPVAGVVHAPALGALWMGCETEGAFEAEVEDGVPGPRRGIRVRPAPTRIVAVGSRSHGSAETSEWLERLAVEAFVSRGSSLKFCLLASGQADLYPRLGRTMEWDTAAGDAVLRAAGGLVATLDRRPLLYGKREQPEDCAFANPHFIAFGDPALAERAASAPLVAA